MAPCITEKERRIPDRFAEISDDDFRRALSARCLASAAIRLPAQTHNTTACVPKELYANLATYHRTALQKEWQTFAKNAAELEETDSALVEDLIQNRIRGWHNGVVEFGDAIDWTTDAFGQNLNGFYNLTWTQPALERYALTNDPRIVRWLTDTVMSFYQMRNAFPAIRPGDLKRVGSTPVFHLIGIKQRLPVLLNTYLCLLQTDPHASLVEAFLKTFLGYARYLYAYTRTLNLRGKKNVSFGLAGVYPLLWISLYFPEFRESRTWEACATKRLLELTKKEFFSDGGYAQRVWGYGQGHLSKLADLHLCAVRRKRPILGLLPFLKKAYRWYAKTLGPNELMPSFGDCGLNRDEGTSVIDKALSIFPDKHDRTLGVDTSRSYFLKPSGFAILRNGSHKDAVYANINVGTFAGWHSHQDLLSMNIWGMGKPLLEEVGRWGPYQNFRNTEFYTPEAHNLFLVDGMLYDCRREGARDVRWHSCEAVDCLTATHRAYRYGGYAHAGAGSHTVDAIVRRTVVFVKDPGYFLVVDSVVDEHAPTFKHAVSQVWHSPFSFQRLSPTSVRTKGYAACLLAFARPDGLQEFKTECNFQCPDNPWYTRHTLRARRWMDWQHPGLPGFATCIYPFRGRAPHLSIRPIECEHSPPYRAEGYTIETDYGTDTVLLNPEGLPGVLPDDEVVPRYGKIMLAAGRGVVEWK